MMKQLLLIWPTLLAAAGREAGAVKQTDGAAYFVNAYPVVPRLASGKLLVWSATAKTEKAARVVAALSTDGARSWSAPQSLIQTAGMSDLDPNILVDGKRVFVYSTTVAVNMTRIDRSQVYMTQSDDEGASWSKPVEIAMPFKYFVGKRHREFFANRDVRGFLFPFRATKLADDLLAPSELPHPALEFRALHVLCSDSSVRASKRVYILAGAGETQQPVEHAEHIWSHISDHIRGLAFFRQVTQGAPVERSTTTLEPLGPAPNVIASGGTAGYRGLQVLMRCQQPASVSRK